MEKHRNNKPESERDTAAVVLQNWRAHTAVPLPAKQFVTVMMTVSFAGSWWVMPSNVRWIPAACCAVVATWLWRLPNR